MLCIGILIPCRQLFLQHGRKQEWDDWGASETRWLFSTLSQTILMTIQEPIDNDSEWIPILESMLLSGLDIPPSNLIGLTN